MQRNANFARCLDKEKERALRSFSIIAILMQYIQWMISTSNESVDLPSTSKSATTSKIIKLNKNLPNPFPIPTFRHSTEVHLKKGAFQESHRKYMVQTLATILMTYKSWAALADCRAVSQALHKNLNARVMKAQRCLEMVVLHQDSKCKPHRQDM